MKQYIVFTTEGETTAPEISVDVDNCQVLGLSYGNSQDQAIDRLFNVNQWIEKAGFSKANSTAIQVITREIKKDVETLLEYLRENDSDNNNLMYKSSDIQQVITRLTTSLA